MYHVSGKIYRGPRPKSFKDLQAAGITKVITLQTGVYEFLHNDQYEFESATKFGIEVVSLKLSDVFPITMNQWHELFYELYSIPTPGLIYIHCLKGEDRTGMVSAIIRMRREGWSFKDAYREMRKMGFNMWPYFWWVPFLKRFEMKRGE